MILGQIDEDGWIEALKTGGYTISRTIQGAKFGYTRIYLRRKKGSNLPKISHILNIELSDDKVEEFIVRLKKEVGL